MAKDKIYVYVDKIAAGKIADAKLKSKAPALLTSLVDKYVEKSGVATTKGDKKQEGFMIGGTLSLEVVSKGGRTDLMASLAPVLATWPKKSMFGLGSMSKGFQGIDEKKLESEAKDLMDLLAKDYAKEAVKQFQKRAK